MGQVVVGDSQSAMVTDLSHTHTFPAECLRQFSAAVFMHFGIPEADAEQAADVLAKSDLRGIDSHGVARLHTYFDMLELGESIPSPTSKSSAKKPASATVDGDNGLGLVVGPKANEIAMDKAEQHRLGLGQRLQHQPLRHRRLLSSESARTRSHRLGDDQLHQTGRAAVGRGKNARHQSHRHRLPGLEEPPIVIDMATSAVAYGKIEIALRKKSRFPQGWIVDKDGRDTTNPQDMIDGGAQLPLGSEREMGGHKGYGLAPWSISCAAS